MFRPRFGRRRHYGGGGGGGLGLLLLGMQFLSFFSFLSRSDRFFPVTLGVLGLNVAAYLRPRVGAIHWPSVREACISLQEVWFRGDWKRLLTSPFVHASDYHLYYNMASFMWKALTLERHYGSGYFAYMVAVFSVATGLLYLGLHYLMAEFLDQWSAVQSCAVGFSAVIFALKVVTTHIQPPGLTLVMGFFPVPARLACWVELVVISVLFPNVSFVGHLAGILVGLAYVWGPLKTLMDVPLSLIDTGTGTGRGPQGQGGFAGASYTYRAAPTGFRRNNVAREQQEEHGEEEEERELQEAMRLSLHDRGGGRGGRRGEAPGSHSPAAPRAAASHSERRDSLERDMQIAIDRSIREQGPEEPSPPETPPPPFNPAYPPAPPPPNTEGGPGRNLPSGGQGATVRRRHPAGAVGPPPGMEGEGNLDTIRAARLRKFGRETSL